MMSNAHSTGWLIPQIPSPLAKRTETATSRPIARQNERKNPTTQKSGVFRERTIEPILSETEA